MREAIDKRAMALLSGGHLATDFTSGAVPALLPFLVERFDLTYTLAAVVMLAWTAASSLVQPLFGLWSDRRGAVWLLPSGVAVAGVGIALAAEANTYAACLAAVVLSGLGVAAYHPEGSKFAAYVSGRRRASGMSLFSIGGNVGYALGPIVTTPLVLLFGLRGGALVAVPCLAVAALLLARRTYLATFIPERREQLERAGEDRPGAMALLLCVIAFRNVAWFGLLTFVPLYVISQGHSEAYGNNLLAAMLVAGAVGTLALGPAADRFGRRPVLLATLVATPPLTLVFVVVGGLAGAVALAVVGACVVGTFGVTIVMSQEYLPRHVAVASGLTVGMALALGGVAAVALGALADAIDLRTALLISAAAPLVAIVPGLALPSSRLPPQVAPELASP